MKATSKVVKNFGDTASLIVRVDKVRKNPNPKFLNKLKQRVSKKKEKG